VDDWINEVLSVLQNMLENGEEIPDEVYAEIVSALEESAPIEAPEPQGTDLLWHLSNGDPSAFVSYLRTVPDPALNSLLKDPTQLQNIIQKFSQQFPPDQPQQIGGIEKAPLHSSNIWGFNYDPKSGGLNVRFNGGSTYHYDNVPPYIFNVFQRGAVPAKTTGQNQYGKWWQGKNPSLGAAFYELIRSGPYPYERVA
jgi:KTSC domain